MTAKTDHSGRLEGVIEVLILLAVGGMAGAASFTHVHDWTMHNSPVGTGGWFGWANAMVSELIPTAAGLEARRRKRVHGHAGTYPVALILAAVALSLTGQFAEARPSLSGWIVSAVPALGFLALVKLILSRPNPPTTPAVDRVDQVDEHTNTIPARPATPVNVPAELLPGARIIANSHRQATGTPITPNQLAERMNLPATTAAGLLTILGNPTATPTPPDTTRAINGTRVHLETPA
jgi:hypothetical protein